MKIKRFWDKDMRRVLKQVRSEQGPDAVILSNRRIDGGIEVIAAVDYDAALMQHALGKPAEAASAPAAPAAEASPAEATPAAAPAPTPAPTPASGNDTATAAAVAPEAAPAKAAPQPAPALRQQFTPPAADPVAGNEAAANRAAQQAATAWREANEHRRAEEALKVRDVLEQRAAAARAPAPLPSEAGAASLASMQAEIRDLKGLLRRVPLTGLSNTNASPAATRVLGELARIGIAADIAQALADGVVPGAAADDTWRHTLAERLPVLDDTIMDDGGVVALVGPTGVGKTTTIAKLATRFALTHGADSVALVCADAWRIGAREHLAAFAGLLGVPVHNAPRPEELPALLERLSSKKLVLIDTEGLSQRDADLATRLAAWRDHGNNVRFYLALSAASQEAGLDETVRAFRQVPLAGAIVTKIDEASQLGGVINVLIRRELPLAWVTDGQQIPDDLHAAARQRDWLIERARDCVEARLPAIDEHLIGDNYGMLSAGHA